MKNKSLFLRYYDTLQKLYSKTGRFQGRIQIRINRPVKSLFPRCCVKALGHICPLCPSSFALPREKIQFYRVRSSFDRVIFRSGKLTGAEPYRFWRAAFRPCFAKSLAHIYPLCPSGSAFAWTKISSPKTASHLTAVNRCIAAIFC